MARGIALESPINVSVVPHAGTLLAFGEQGLPWALDPLTLETRGRFDFGGGLNVLSPLAAHAKIDPASGELWGFGVSYARQDARLNLYRFAADGTLLARRRLPLDHPCSLHDFCLAPRHAVFHLGPYLLDMPALAEGKAPIDALRWQPELGTRLLVVDRATGEAVAAPAIGSRYCLHTVNAWEGDGRLTVDLIELERPVYDDYQVVPDLFTAVGEGCPVRLVVDLASGELLERREIAYRNAPDFPAMDPALLGRPSDSFWLLGIAATGRPGRKFFDQLVRLDWREPGERDLWQAPAGVYLGSEPVFAAAPAVGAPGVAGAAGVVICHQYDARRDESSFLLFAALDVAAGPFAVLRLESPLQLAFHAVFQPH
jgi:carotenoid cleavage dioxygenase-like enzyme